VQELDERRIRQSPLAGNRHSRRHLKAANQHNRRGESLTAGPISQRDIPCLLHPERLDIENCLGIESHPKGVDPGYTQKDCPAPA
jgi:hypothetical protein